MLGIVEILPSSRKQLSLYCGSLFWVCGEHAYAKECRVLLNHTSVASGFSGKTL